MVLVAICGFSYEIYPICNVDNLTKHIKINWHSVSKSISKVGFEHNSDFIVEN